MDLKSTITQIHTSCTCIPRSGGVSGVCRHTSLWFCPRSASPLSNTVFSSSRAILPSTLNNFCASFVKAQKQIICHSYRISSILTQIHTSLSLRNLTIYHIIVWYVIYWRFKWMQESVMRICFGFWHSAE